MTSSWFFLSTLNYDARSTTHQISKFSLPIVFTYTKSCTFCEFFTQYFGYYDCSCIFYLFVTLQFCKFYENVCRKKNRPVSSTRMVLLLFKALLPDKGKNKHFWTIRGFMSIFGTGNKSRIWRHYVISKPDCTIS